MKSGRSTVVRYATGCAATGVDTAAAISAAIGSICSGPFKQFTPTTSAPAPASSFAASPGVWPSYARGAGFSNDIVTITGSPVAPARSTNSSASPSQPNVSPIQKSGGPASS